MATTKEYTVQLLLSHYETITVDAENEEEALSKATYKANTEERYNRDHSNVYSAEIVTH